VSRFTLGLEELDRVFGGGLVPGSVTLLGGEPGIGKSTLLLQVAAALALQPGGAVVYASGEESTHQIAERARRLGLDAARLQLVHANELESILQLATAEHARLLIIDSIQTMQLSSVESTAGSVPQLRESTAALVRFAKGGSAGENNRGGPAVMIVGHVTKDGGIAGPKLLEHLVDTVLYFESDVGSRYRLLRATKNRFGPVNELGFFAMTAGGLREVKNPTAILLTRKGAPVAGSVVMVARDGGRPLLIEVQALVDPARFGNPRRVAQGVDTGRLSMLLAVMHRHAGLALADFDVFVNLVGGIDIAETATDLPLVLALASSLRDRPLPAALVAFGEVGLTGEVRPVAYGDERLRELAKQGYSQVILPRDNAPRQQVEGLQLHPVGTVVEAIEAAFGASG
jgi:DNA repair protein RadA/Sms